MTRPLALLAVLGLLAAGCGSSSSSSKSSSSSSGGGGSSSSSSTSSKGKSAGGTTITMKNVMFDPKAETVKVGEKVTWKNEDQFNHNVKADSGASFHSADFSGGGTYSFTPTKPGTIKYECTIHPGMVATLTVTK